MIDRINRKIIDLLRKDPQMANRAMAQALGLSETTIGVRLERMSSSNVARVIAQLNARALGWRVSALLDVYLENVDPEEVVTRLHSLSNVITIFQLVGSPALLIKIAAEDLAEISRIALEVVGADPAVRHVDVHVCLGYGRTRAGFGNLESPRVEGGPRSADLQGSITEMLARDGRISNREISRVLGVAEATVRAHIRRMQQRGMLRYILICNPERVGYTAPSFIWLRAAPGVLQEVIATLSHHPNIFGVTMMTGFHNLMVSIYATDWAENWEIAAQITQWRPGLSDPVIRPAISFARHRYELAFPSSVTEDAMLGPGEFAALPDSSVELDA